MILVTYTDWRERVGDPRHNVFGNSPDEVKHEADLGPRMAVLDNLVDYIRDGRAEIVSKHEVPPINGRRMFKVTVALKDE
jgi:hypothetical protein